MEACAKEDVSWSEKTFGRNVARLLGNATTRTVLGQAGRKSLETAVRTVGGESLAAASAVMTAISTTGLTIIGGIIIIGSLAYGYY